MNVYAPNKMTTDDIGLRTSPAKLRSIILTRPVEKTIMLGGVAMGKANALPAANVIGYTQEND